MVHHTHKAKGDHPDHEGYVPSSSYAPRRAPFEHDKHSAFERDNNPTVSISNLFLLTLYFDDLTHTVSDLSIQIKISTWCIGHALSIQFCLTSWMSDQQQTGSKKSTNLKANCNVICLIWNNTYDRVELYLLHLITMHTYTALLVNDYIVASTKTVSWKCL